MWEESRRHSAEEGLARLTGDCLKQSCLWEELWVSRKPATEGARPRSVSGSGPHSVGSAQTPWWIRRDGTAISQQAGWWLFTVAPTGCLLAGSKARQGIYGEPLGWCVSGLMTHAPQSLRGFGGDVRVSVRLAAKQSQGKSRSRFIKPFERGQRSS